ncbi:MAG: TatD family hydrolase [Bryobacter sp.]|nr:TatD family hydrolase [Bryobacter sp.]
MRNDFPVFDTHTHLGLAAHSGREMRLHAMLAHMERCGIDRSVLIPWPAVASESEAHNEIGAAIRVYPQLFVGAACLHPFQPREQFLAELDRAVEVCGLRALKLQPQFQPLNPLNRRHDWYWEAALRHRLPVIVHTGNGAPLALPSLYISAARRFPELTLILAHSGGSVYYPEAILAAEICPNIYLDLSTLPAHNAGDVLRQVPSSRIMIGSDLPESAPTEIDKVFHLGLPPEQMHDVLHRTASRVFA